MYSKWEIESDGLHTYSAPKTGFELSLSEKRKWESKLRLWKVLHGNPIDLSPFLLHLCGRCMSGGKRYGCPNYCLIEITKGELTLIRMEPVFKFACREWVKYV